MTRGDYTFAVSDIHGVFGYCLWLTKHLEPVILLISGIVVFYVCMITILSKHPDSDVSVSTQDSNKPALQKGSGMTTSKQGNTDMSPQDMNTATSAAKVGKEHSRSAEQSWNAAEEESRPLKKAVVAYGSCTPAKA